MFCQKVKEVHNKDDLANPEVSKRGCVIRLDISWRITVDHRMHITCCACAYQLLCKRTTAVVRPKILTFSTTYTMFFNNISVIFQQKEGESLTYDTPSLMVLSSFYRSSPAIYSIYSSENQSLRFSILVCLS